jgi:hypothetical protein
MTDIKSSNLRSLPERIATRVVEAVCELPDYNSPDDQPDLVMCTVQQLEHCVLQAFEQLEYDREMERGPDSLPVETTDVIRMRNTLLKAGYTDHGGELWKPPLGKNPLPELDRLREEASHDPYKAVCQGGSGGKCTNPDCEKCWPEEPEARPCTCHPDDNPPKPCPRKYALSECRKAAEYRDQVNALSLECAQSTRRSVEAIRASEKASGRTPEQDRILNANLDQVEWPPENGTGK